MKTNQMTVLITGGGSGIGLALAHKFFAAGNHVVLTGRDENKLKAARAALETGSGAANQRPESPAGETKDPGGAPPPTVRIFAGDVGDRETIQRLVASFPDVNVLVNNAGIQHMYDITELAGDDFAAKIESELRINLTAPVLLSHAFLPQLREFAGRANAGAAIVNITSGLALAPKASAPTYCASKAGLRSFTKALRYQLESHGVRVFEVLAPLVDTAMTAGRGSGKISPEQLADEFWRGWKRNRNDMFIGKSKLLYYVNRLWPSLADSIMRKM